MLRYFNGYLLYPLLEKLSKRQIKPKLQELRKFESLPIQEQLEEQQCALYELAIFCKENVPFYQKLFEEYSFDVEKLKEDASYLLNLPILTKDVIREHSASIQYQGNGPLHVRKTGGSTGQSVFFYYDNHGLDWTAAINLFSYEMAGKKMHHSDCHISADLEFGKPPLKDLILDYIKLLSQNRNRLMISSFSEIELRKLYKSLKWKRPYLLQGHPSSLYAIANYIEQNKIKPIRLCEVFEPTGEMVTSKIIEKIEKNTLCNVTNRYGNAEFGVIAHAEKGRNFSKLKVFQKAFYVEACVQSNIIVTGLTNYGFPLLRYDTGDIATVTHENDGSYISDIQGRIHDIIDINGDLFPSHYIMDFMDHQVGGIREFQILLESHSPFPILTVVLENQEDRERVLAAVKNKWPIGLDIKFIDFENLVRSGWRQKFRHLLDLREKKYEI